MYDYESLNCFVNHLKKQNKLEASSFPEHSIASLADTLGNTRCDQIIDEVLATAYQQVHKATKVYLYDMRCVIDGLKENNFSDEVLMQIVYKHADQLHGASKILKKFESRTDAATMITDALTECLIESKFEELLGFLIDKNVKSAEDSEDDLENFCETKYAIDKGFVDPQADNVDVNPKNLNFTSDDCNYQKFLEDSEQVHRATLKSPINYELMDQKQVDCAMEDYRRGKYLQRILTVKTLLPLSSLDLAASRKDVLREIIIQATASVTIAATIKCP